MGGSGSEACVGWSMGSFGQTRRETECLCCNCLRRLGWWPDSVVDSVVSVLSFLDASACAMSIAADMTQALSNRRFSSPFWRDIGRGECTVPYAQPVQLTPFIDGRAYETTIYEQCVWSCAYQLRMLIPHLMVHCSNACICNTLSRRLSFKAFPYALP